MAEQYPVPEGHWRCRCGESWYLWVRTCKDCGYVRTLTTEEAVEHLADCPFGQVDPDLANRRHFCPDHYVYLHRDRWQCPHGLMANAYTCPEPGCAYQKQFVGRT